jgi:HD-GYP domain-containing protein (c-di-GMP phosphodiesterase class II)
VDVWDALNEDRPYRRGFTPSEARQIMLQQAGTQFDPYILRIFVERVLGSLP